jgi:RNA polymerase sigma-70 factor (ECF subfamily)
LQDYHTYHDKALVLLLRSDDHGAFSEIYNRYWAVLYRHALKMTKDEDLAKDVVQDVFVSLWDKANDLQLDVSLNAYLYASTRNKILNLFAKEKVKTNYVHTLEVQLKKGENITDHKLRERLLNEKIEEGIAQLPKKMRQVFEMSRKENLSYKEIADELQLSDKTVKKQVSNAIKILRLKLDVLLSLLIICFFA